LVRPILKELTALTSTARSLDDEDQLVGDDARLLQPFHPAFTYPIYGEKEVIFGYKDLDISVSAHQPRGGLINPGRLMAVKQPLR
jgi:histone acetyltransferase 1